MLDRFFFCFRFFRFFSAESGDAIGFGSFNLIPTSGRLCSKFRFSISGGKKSGTLFPVEDSTFSGSEEKTGEVIFSFGIGAGVGVGIGIGVGVGIGVDESTAAGCFGDS